MTLPIATTTLQHITVPDVDLDADVMCNTTVCLTPQPHPATYVVRARCACGTDTETWCDRARRYVDRGGDVTCEDGTHGTADHTLALTFASLR